MGDAWRSERAEVFCRLADPGRYVACRWDLSADEQVRGYWIDYFKNQFEISLAAAQQQATARGELASQAMHRLDDCRRAYHAWLDDFGADPRCFGRVTILTVDKRRDDFLREHGFEDAYLDIKRRENDKALPLLGGLCRQLDGLKGGEQLRAIVLGVFAGNIFDMGSAPAAARMIDGTLDFFAVREGIARGHWLVDDYSALERRMMQGPLHRKAILFVDNAGGDFVLGMVPLARWLAQRGTQVIIAANEKPTLNDMTHADVEELWPRLLEAEPSLRDLPITRMSTGTVEPLIDLSAISPALNRAAADADLVVLEGMGRAVESNFDAAFNCDSLKLAMLKSEWVARQHGGELFDVVCRFSS